MFVLNKIKPITNEQREIFNRLREDREESAMVLEKTSMKGVKKSVTGMYPEQAHFIYELIQNADDVKATKVRFILTHNELLFTHNGSIHFSISNPAKEEEDMENGKLGHVNSITSIGGTTKIESEIGKFGIGFKSVFLYTNTPHIYDPPFMFKIERFIVPKLLEIDHSERGCDETLFCFPFDSKMKPDTVYKEINEKLQNLDNSLLFLRYLEKIEWENKDGMNGAYSKDVESSDHHVTSLTKKINEDQHIHKYLIFEKNIDVAHQYKPIINIAFKFDSSENKIISDGMINAYCFFSTLEYTGLKFIVQAPFLLTDNRAGIKQGEDWNKKLINQIANLIADILPDIRDKGLLDIDFLNILPISEDDFPSDNKMFRPVYDAVLNKLKSDEKLLPANDGSYVSSKEALLGRGKGLIDLLNSEQLTLLLNKQNANWLDSNITENNPFGLWDYFSKKLTIEVITPAKFAEYFSTEFIEEQNDEWVIKFYKFLCGRPELLKESGILRKKLIIRLEKYNRHVLPLKDHAYLPSNDENINKLDFPFIKNVIASNPEAKKFLNFLEFKEPDGIAGISKEILPQYNEEDAISKINNTLNLKHAKWLNKTLKESPEGERKQKLLSELRNTQFLLCKNMVLEDRSYRSPNDGIYLGETYNYNKEIETFFGGNDEIWLLDDIYKDKYLFSWEIIPGNGNGRLIEILMQNFSIEWVKAAKINKNDDGKTIRVTNGMNFLSLTLNNEKTNVNLEIDDGRTDEFIVKTENGELNIYKEILNIEILELISCKSKIAVSYRKPREYDDYVIIREWMGNHKRGLGGFDPDSNIEGLSYALETITIEKAKIIWKILKKHIRLIHGTVETATHKNYDNKKIMPPEYSKMGKLLISNSWLPDKNGDYDKPSNLFLSDLHDEFDIEGANKIEEKLGFKTHTNQDLLKQLPQEEQEIYEIVSNAVQKGMKKEEIINFIKMKVEPPQVIKNTDSIEEISKTIRNELSHTPTNNLETPKNHSGGWTGSPQEKIDETKDEYRKRLSKDLDGMVIISKCKIVEIYEISSKSEGHIDGKEFLREKYNGYCQICNTRLDIGNDNYIFFKTHISEKKHGKAWADMVWNILCLCPNCHYLEKHGQNNDLSDILRVARLASDGEIAPEPVEERNGDYYIVNIKLSGENKQLFFDPEHLIKLSVITEHLNENRDSAIK